MENLSLIEIRSVSNSNQKLNVSFSTPNRQGRHVVGPYYKRPVKDVTEIIQKGQYGLKTKFTIIYLYDIQNDQAGREFLTTYGWQIHNNSSANIRILTYFTEHMAEKWSNVQHRNLLDPDKNSDPHKVLDIIKNMQIEYGVKTLPSMVVIKKDNLDKEESCYISLSQYDKEGLKKVFTEVMDIINDHCDQDFKVISLKISGNDVKISTTSNMNNLNTCNYISMLVKKESQCGPSRYTQYNLASELDIDPKTLYNKRLDNSFTRDELLYLAVRFHMSIDDLNEFLRQNNHIDLGFKGRDEIIRSALYYSRDLEDVERQLTDKGHKGIMIKRI